MDAPGLKAKAVSKAGRGMRALFSKAPKAAAVIDRAARLLRRKLPGRVSVTADSISLELHAAVAAVKISAVADGVLTVIAPAAALGPGYVQYVVAVLDEILEEIDFLWDPDDPGFASTRDVAALRRAHTEWLQHELGELVAGRRSAQLEIPQHPRYQIEDAAVLTPMGPRALAWCQAVQAEGSAGRDFWPLWEAATPAALAWARAMWLVWTEVLWRTPIETDEQEAMAQVHRELTQAHRLDSRSGSKAGATPGPASGSASGSRLELPWAEWAELIDYLDLDDDVTEEVRERGAKLTPSAGYHRHPARFELVAGWSLQLSANFSESWYDEGTSMLASDGERTIRCSCAESEGDAPGAILAKIPMHADVIARHDEGGLQGRVEARDDEINEVRVLTAIMATEGSAAVITVVQPRGDDDWVISTWCTLRCDPSEAS